MKCAFLILAHKHPKQLQRLTDYLLANDCSVFVHIDSKAGKVFDQYTQNNSSRMNLYLYSEYAVYWGSFNQIRATFLLLERALKNSDFDFVSLISGQDVPIKSISKFQEYLSNNKDKSFIQYHPVPAYNNLADNGGLDRVRCFWITGGYPKVLTPFFNKGLVALHALQRWLKLYKKFDQPLYGGANWFTLNRLMAEYVIDFKNKNAGFFKKFRNTRCADEIIFQTILLNSLHKNNVKNEILRFIDWQNGPEYPRIFRSEDFERLLNHPAFFARKFDRDVDAKIIDQLYNRLT